ncbi:MAG: hypothetical protein KDK36_01830, partial [Leptospiraceae bacterium]|nr:hypothetical protein [Leptospiraceae bacterium]
IEQQKQSPLPQWFADRTDWDIFIEETFLAINTLPEEDRNPSIYVNDYGHAGAINYYLPQFKVLSGHNQFYFWGKKAKPNSIVVYGENNYKFFEPYFKESKFIGSYSREYSNEFSVPIYFLKGAKVPMYKYWERLKNFN